MDRHFVSFPKSGRSWLRYALHELGLSEGIAFHHDGLEYNDGARPPLDLDAAARAARYGGGQRIVYMERDPRDVMVSLYHQVTGRFSDMFGYEGTLSAFIRDPYFGARNLRAFRDQWAALCAEGRALRVTYEECHADFPGTLAAVVAHYGFAVPPGEIDRAAAAADFSAMRRVEHEGTFAEPWLRLRNGAPKVRLGRVGGYAAALAPEDVRYLDAVFGTAPPGR